MKNVETAKYCEVSNGVVVSMFYPQQRDGRIDAIENGMPESRWVEQQVGHL
jgi:hypothetical protein